MSEKNTKEETASRPPIVIVMGHIDHGKTKILDWYRKTKVVEEESGGITQHIGAYEVEYKNKKITFIDTPGHETFSKMRSRGAKVADIAVLVVAADEGIKTQTKEAIEIIRANNLPFVVAINKIDKPEANSEKIKQQLAEENVLLESYSGKVPSVEISAKIGTNMNSLLEMLLLVAELEDLKANPEKLAEGVVIESHRDAKRGNSAILLIRDGTLRRGQIMTIGKSVETLKILENFLGRTVEESGPSSPILVAGLAEIPAIGDTFHAHAKKKDAEKFIKTIPAKEKEGGKSTAKTFLEGIPTFNIILKADVDGSREAVEESFKKIGSETVRINIIRSEVGDINESDVKMAQATKLITIVGFKVSINPSAQELAENSNIRIVTGEIIYELINNVKEKISELIPPEIKRTDLGKIKILKIFSVKNGSASGKKRDGAKQVIGGRVEDGIVKVAMKCDIKRVKELLGKGKILELQRQKIKTDEIAKGEECGILVEADITIQTGDVLEIFQEETIKITV